MNALPCIGWREWVVLPDLGIKHVKAKVDTGARTSTLHASDIVLFHQNGGSKVKFVVHPKQTSHSHRVHCVADLLDRRWITDSGGHREYRCVIHTSVILGDTQWQIELTLTDRNNMRFRMLLGRTALNGRVFVNPDASFLLKSHGAG